MNSNFAFIDGMNIEVELALQYALHFGLDQDAREFKRRIRQAAKKRNGKA